MAARALDQGLARRHAAGALARHLGGQRQRRGGSLAGWHDFFDQADGQGLRRVDALAAQNHALGPAFTHQPRQVLCAARARQQADGRFRQGHLRMFFGDADVASERAFKPAAHGIAIDGGDADAAKRGQRLERLAKRGGHGERRVLVTVGKHFQIGTRREELGAAARDHERVHVRVGIQVGHQLRQRVQAGQGPRVGGRVVEGHQGRVATAFQQQIGIHFCHRKVSVAPSFKIARATIRRMISFVPSRI